MKHLKTTFIALLLLGSIASCRTSTKQNHDQEGIEYTSEYICPMHCEGSGSDTAGTCPVCGMDYIKNEK